MIKFLLRVLFVTAGLVFALSLMVVMAVLLVLWGMRALWCKLTGQPVNPFVMRMSPRSGFEQMFQQANRNAKPLRKPTRSGMDDVTDVQVKD